MCGQGAKVAAHDRARHRARQAGVFELAQRAGGQGQQGGNGLVASQARRLQQLDGDRKQVKRLQLNAGDLQFFLGRFSLHQVTENTGDNDRLLLIMSFSEKPGMVGSMARVKDLYGKITEAHSANKVRVMPGEEQIEVNGEKHHVGKVRWLDGVLGNQAQPLQDPARALPLVDIPCQPPHEAVV